MFKFLQPKVSREELEKIEKLKKENEFLSFEETSTSTSTSNQIANDKKKIRKNK